MENDIDYIDCNIYNEWLTKQLFHELWSSQIGKEGYDKQKWIELQSLLLERGINV